MFSAFDFYGEGLSGMGTNDNASVHYGMEDYHSAVCLKDGNCYSKFSLKQ